MPFALLVVAAAVIVGYVLGGRLARLADAGLRANVLLFVGLALQVTVDVLAGRGLVDGWPATATLVVSQVIVGAWIVANIRHPGMALVLGGLVLNAVVIAANGAMPVSADALATTGLADPGDIVGKHELMTDDTRFAFLADVIPLPPLRTVISVGDVVLALGLARLVPHLMGTRRSIDARSKEPAA